MNKELKDLLKKIYKEKRIAKEQDNYCKNDALNCEILGLLEGYLFGLEDSPA